MTSEDVEPTLLKDWPDIKEDLENLLKNPYIWLAGVLNKAHLYREYETVDTVADIMKFLGRISYLAK